MTRHSPDNIFIAFALPPSPLPPPLLPFFWNPFLPSYLFLTTFFSPLLVYIYFSLPIVIFAFLHVLLSLSASHFFCFQFFLSLPPPSLLSFVSPFLPLRGFSLPPEGRRGRRCSVRATSCLCASVAGGGTALAGPREKAIRSDNNNDKGDNDDNGDNNNYNNHNNGDEDPRSGRGSGEVREVATYLSPARPSRGG